MTQSKVHPTLYDVTYLYEKKPIAGKFDSDER